MPITFGCPSCGNGSIPSERLREAAGRFCFAVLLVALLWMLVCVSTFRSTSPFTVFSPDPTPTRRTGASASPSVVGDFTLLVVLTVCAVAQIAYTILHHALYSAGRSAARRAGTEDAD